MPIRIPAATFQPDHTLRRIASANALVEGFVVPPRATAEQFQLFQRYQQARHGEGDMATMSFYDYRAMVEDTPVETLIVEFRDPDDRLVGACLTDRLGDGLSAVYSFFAPGLDRRSLGTHTILWLIERARCWACLTCISAIGCRRAARWPTRRGSGPARFWSAAPGGC